MLISEEMKLACLLLTASSSDGVSLAENPLMTFL